MLSRDVDAALGNARVSGVALWHSFDFKADDRYQHDTACDYVPGVYPPNCSHVTISYRPGGKNNKGVVDFWRRPKPAFAMVAAKYQTANEKR